MRLIVSPDPGSADVSVLLHYDTGSRDDPPGLEGIARLVEHLMFLGTKHAPKKKLAQLLERAGATNVNTTTSLRGRGGSQPDGLDVARNRDH